MIKVVLEIVYKLLEKEKKNKRKFFVFNYLQGKKKKKTKNLFIVYCINLKILKLNLIISI